jgi:hypothetical protein
MNKVFFKKITTAFRSAGWLMVGTALIIAVASLIVGLSSDIKQWGYGSFVVGGCFIAIDVIISYLMRDKS